MNALKIIIVGDFAYRLHEDSERGLVIQSAAHNGRTPKFWSWRLLDEEDVGQEMFAKLHEMLDAMRYMS
jgi:hypothetical protein